MLLNVSYNNPKVRQKIDHEVGAPFSLVERIKMNGVGSPKLFITDSSLHIQNLLILDNNRNVCNIELRPKGILVGFRSLLESYVLVIPFYKLSVYKGKAEEYSIHRDDYFLKISADEERIHRFIKKLMELKLKNNPTQIGDI
jgi:hypothetical protein